MVESTERQRRRLPLREQDPLVSLARKGARLMLERSLEEELTSILGAERYERTGEGHRQGYRNGFRTRDLVVGTDVFEDLRIPRGILHDGTEVRSQRLPRRVRRSEALDAAVLDLYAGGVNTRKVKVALRALFRGGAALSKSSVSRIVSLVDEEMQAWRTRSLAEEPILYLFLDGFYVPIRHDRVTRDALLVAHGVRANGERVVLGIALGPREGTEAWLAFLRELVERGLKSPLLVAIDGCAGLRRAVAEVFPHAEVQRCTVHKTRNVLSRVPRHLHDAVLADLRAIYHAGSEAAAREAAGRFRRRWQEKLATAVETLERDFEETLTFFHYPPSQSKALRTTNIIERFFLEVRRRVKTLGALPNEEAALRVVYALLLTGLIRWRRIVGWEEIPDLLARLNRNKVA